MSDEIHGLVELDEPECRRLLGTASLGHLGFTEAALPMILPVHMTAHGDEIVVATLSGSSTLTGSRGDVVVLEAEVYEPATHEGWTVSVIGPSRVITDEQEIADLARHDFGSWTADGRPGYVAVRMTLVRGRRLAPAPSPIGGPGPAPAQRRQPV